MPDAVSVPAPDNPPAGYGPVGATVQQASWIGKQLAGLTDHQLQRLVLAAMQFASLALLGFFVWRADVRQSEAEIRHIEDQATSRRREEAVDERNRQEKKAMEERFEKSQLATGSMLLKHCSDQDKIRRDEDAIYRKDSIAVQNKLADAVNSLTRKMAGIKDIEIRE